MDVMAFRGTLMQLETVTVMMVVIIRIVVMMVEIVVDPTLTKDIVYIVNAKPMENKAILWGLKIIEKILRAKRATFTF